MSLLFSCHLANRSVIALGGADRHAFLQGLISNDIGLCTQEQAIYAALLTPQGKFLHDLFIIDAGEEFLIDCETARAEDLIKRLTAYKLRAKVVLRNAVAEFDVWGIEGKESGIKSPIVFIDPRLPELGIRTITKKGAGNPNNSTDFSAYDRHRLALGVADGSRDMIVEKSTLTDGNFDLLNGISWTKGCYVGQELTARMHYRALVKKRMLPVKIEGEAPAFGAIIKSGDDEIGDMRSSAGEDGLALLNIEKTEAAAQKNETLLCGGSKLSVSLPAWMKSSAR